ncbi:MAG TPA: SEC-C metal-binding domain-containing protein [Polyangiaceae bacterium]
MTPGDLPILSRAQVDTFSDRVKDARSRMELAKRIAHPGGDAEDVLHLLETRAWSITREELTALGAWVPLLGGRFLHEVYQDFGPRDEARIAYLTCRAKGYRNSPQVRAGLLSMWSATFAVGTRLVLAAMGDLAFADVLAPNWSNSIGPTFPGTSERIHSVAMRGAWAAARIGRPFLPAYKRILSTPGDEMPRYDAALAVTAIGLRHARYRDDARRIVAAMVDSADGAGDREFARWVVERSHRALDTPEAAMQDAATYGAYLLAHDGSSLPDDSPYKYAPGAPVPHDLAMLVATNGTYDSMTGLAFASLPWVATRATAEELYYPRDMARALDTAWTAEGIEEIYARHLGARQEPVVRSAPRVGRNEACSCGSGKKFKRCCG